MKGLAITGVVAGHTGIESLEMLIIGIYQYSFLLVGISLNISI